MRYVITAALLAVLSLMGLRAQAETYRAPKLVTGRQEAATRFHSVLPFRPLTRARDLRIGEQLTCRRGCALELHDGTRIGLAPEAEIVAASPTFQRFPDEDVARRCMAIEIVSGRVSIERPARPAPFVVQTARGTLALPMGRAQVAVHPDRALIVTGETGASVRRARRWTSLAPRRLHVLRPQRPTNSQPVVSPPTWKPQTEHHQPLALAITHPRGVVGGAFSPVSGAAGYRVEIAEDADFSRIHRQIDLPSEADHFSATLSEGTYHARVTATDTEGMVSATSSPIELRVLRAALPVDGFLSGPRTVVVPKDGRLRLLDVQGVEISVDDRGFFAAPAELPAPTRDVHRIALRLVDAPATATAFRLEARALHARVTMTPRLPAWPDDRIRATVRLEDPSGRIDPESFVPTLQVRVGSVPVPVQWRREGATWRTSIEGRDLDGPALVEVVALDDRGEWLGWGFVEVVAHQKRAR